MPIQVDLKICTLVTLALVCWVCNEIEKRHSLENDIRIIKVRLGKISNVLERDVLEHKEGLSHVDEELKDLKADFKEFVKGTMGNISNKVDEVHISITGRGWYSTIKSVVDILCSIASGLSYLFPNLRALGPLCSVNYYL